MKIKEIKKENKAVKDFTKKEWDIVDKEHYGKTKKWEKTSYNIVALDDNGKIVGKLNSFTEAGVAHVCSILVANNERGQKIGTELMLKAEEFAKKTGSHKIFLKTGKDWKSVDFYKSLGYKITGKFLNHSFHQDFVIFTKFF